MAKIRMKSFFIAACTTAALVALFGLAACGGNNAAQSSSAASDSAASAQQQDSAQASSVDTYKLSSAWMGMGEDTMTYYYESSSKTAGAVLIYHTNDNTYERWIGAMEAPSDLQRTITDAESGETLSFTVTPDPKEDTIALKTDAGFEASLSPSTIEEVGGVLDEVSSYATRFGEPASSPSAEELGGEFVVKVNTEGLGHIAYSQDGEEFSYADSAFTHANAGDKISLSTQEEDGWKFVKWTKDGKDFSTDKEVEITVDADVEYIAVFEAK